MVLFDGPFEHHSPDVPEEDRDRAEAKELTEFFIIKN